MSDDVETRIIEDEFGVLTQYKTSRGSWSNWSRTLNNVTFMLHSGKKTIDFLLAFKAGGIRLKKNIMDDRIEIFGDLSLLPDDPEPITDDIEAVVINWMLDVGFRGKDRIIGVIYELSRKNSYHPVKEYFEALEWDGTDYYSQLMSHFTFSETTHAFAQIAYKKFMIGAIAKVFEQGQNFMLVIEGPQDIGKSHFVEKWLNPLPDRYASQAIRTDDKDCYKRLMSKFLWEVAELETTTLKADIGALKDFITKNHVTIRVAYGRYDITKPAAASMIGTINGGGGRFLNDPSGSRRYAVVELREISFDYDKIDVNQLWAQMYSAYKQGEPWRLNKTESDKRNSINEDYQMVSPIEELLHQHYNLEASEKIFTSSIEILAVLKDSGLRGSDRPNLMEINAILKRLGRKKDRVKRLYGFWGVQKNPQPMR